MLSTAPDAIERIAPAASPIHHEPRVGRGLHEPGQKELLRKRLYESLKKDDLPEYSVKRSNKWPKQQPAIEWITQAGKAKFDRYFTTLLAK